MYRLFIEAAREHGTYQLMQQDLTLGTSPKAVELQGNEAIAGARVEPAPQAIHMSRAGRSWSSNRRRRRVAHVRSGCASIPCCDGCTSIRR
jgi:hypothetical protein